MITCATRRTLARGATAVLRVVTGRGNCAARGSAGERATAAAADATGTAAAAAALNCGTGKAVKQLAVAVRVSRSLRTKPLVAEGSIPIPLFWAGSPVGNCCTIPCQERREGTTAGEDEQDHGYGNGDVESLVDRR